MNLDISKPTLISATKLHDNRGFMQPLYENEVNDEICIKMSSSNKGVVRGLHWQKVPHAQQKFIYVLNGTVKDVCLRIDENKVCKSDKHEFIISSSDEKCLFIPDNYAHSYQAVSEEVAILYVCLGKYSPESEVCFNPLAYDINWDKTILTVSKKDAEGH